MHAGHAMAIPAAGADSPLLVSHPKGAGLPTVIAPQDNAPLTPAGGIASLDLNPDPRHRRPNDALGRVPPDDGSVMTLSTPVVAQWLTTGVTACRTPLHPCQWSTVP